VSKIVKPHGTPESPQSAAAEPGSRSYRCAASKVGKRGRAQPRPSTQESR
jgi:hypothetical protein